MATVLFLCPHSAAKSIIATAYFNQIAQASDLNVVADYAGTEPDEQVSPAVVAMLGNEGIDVSDYQPRLVTADDLTHASLVVSLGCSLDGFNVDSQRIEFWNDIPSPSAHLQGARDSIYALVQALVSRLTD